jgi:uncharacterized membrane protein YhiD involved in acid resistance
MLPHDAVANAPPLVSFRNLGFENFDWLVLSVMGGRMALAACLGALIAYRPWRLLMRHARFDRTESGAQVLIAVAGALITVVIGNNVALAFGLVGLGGFIRFRSGIKDPREAGVMFFMIGIGMSCGIGIMPVALVAVAFAFVLLVTLDAIDHRQRKLAKRRIKFSSVASAREFEPLVRRLLSDQGAVVGSRISPQKDEVAVDVLGDKITSAGDVLGLLITAGISFEGEVSCEEL